jgi:CheY-like chemotaxis protein
VAVKALDPAPVASSHRQGVKTILVVDDELASAEVLSLILEEEGYRTFCAANGQHGLARVQDVNPHLVVLDFMMPVMNGAEMASALRELPGMRHIKILMSSSLPEETVRNHFSKYDAFLRKPYNVDAALKLIAELLKD